MAAFSNYPNRGWMKPPSELERCFCAEPHRERQRGGHDRISRVPRANGAIGSPRSRAIRRRRWFRSCYVLGSSRALESAPGTLWPCLVLACCCAPGHVVAAGVVTAPGQRYRPAVAAQTYATLAELFPDRFWVPLGSGEALNEHVTGGPWPTKEMREDPLLRSISRSPIFVRSSRCSGCTSFPWRHCSSIRSCMWRRRW